MGIYHAASGWSFERKPDGSVEVVCHPGHHRFSATLDQNTWASLVAAVSRDGDRDDTFARALRLHNGEGEP